MTTLQGSDKQIKWATDIITTLNQKWEDKVNKSILNNEFSADLKDEALQKFEQTIGILQKYAKYAGWWIDHGNMLFSDYFIAAKLIRKAELSDDTNKIAEILETAGTIIIVKK